MSCALDHHCREDALLSPCINVCVIDEHQGLCAGCGRTIFEIAGWARLTDGERTEIMAGLAERLKAAGLTPLPAPQSDRRRRTSA